MSRIPHSLPVKKPKIEPGRQSVSGGAGGGAPVVELSRFRADLGRGRRLRRADALLATADPHRAIRALPGDEFYYVLQEQGLPEAADLLAHGSPAQVQAALDFALWDRDQLDPAATDSWLEAMVEAPVETIGEWGKGLDIELLALLVRRRTRIYDLSLEEAPDEAEGELWPTPDRLFVLDLLGDDDQRAVTMRLLDALYRADHEWVRRVLVGTRGDLDAELEEQAYRWRSGRMADLGFEEYYAALEVYREIDPGSVHLGHELAQPAPQEDEAAGGAYLRFPTALAERLSEATPFARAVAGIGDKGELAGVQAALYTLSNRVLAADRVTPGDQEAVTASLQRMAGTLDLAVELLARGSTEEAVRAVRTVPLLRLHQLGASLTAKLRKLAVALVKQSPYASLRPALDLYEDEDREVIDACRRARPLFPRRLDDPDAGGGGASGERPFASLADIQRASAALERAAAAITLLHGLGVAPATLAPEALPALGLDEASLPGLDAGVLARTILAGALIDEEVRWPPPAGSPGRDQELNKYLKDVARDPAALKAAEARMMAAALAAWPRPPAPEGARAVAARWVAGVLAGLPRLRSKP
jgi:hypothetical protein